MAMPDQHTAIGYIFLPTLAESVRLVPPRDLNLTDAQCQRIADRAKRLVDLRCDLSKPERSWRLARLISRFKQRCRA